MCSNGRSYTETEAAVFGLGSVQKQIKSNQIKGTQTLRLRLRAEAPRKDDLLFSSSGINWSWQE
jgi:hypothetical protein